MKPLTVTILCLLFAGIARASDVQITIDAARLQALMDENAALHVDLVEGHKQLVATKTSLQAAITEDIRNNAAYKKVIDDKDGQIRSEQRKNQKLLDSWGHKLQVLVTWGFWGIVGVYVLAWASRFVNPLGSFGWLFRAGSEIVKAVPAGNVITMLGPKTMTVRAVNTPVVPSPVNVIPVEQTTVAAEPSS